MKKKYCDVGIGECFQLIGKHVSKDDVFMKISHEYDHNYVFIQITQGKWKHAGTFFGPLMDNEEVDTVEVEIVVVKLEKS